MSEPTNLDRIIEALFALAAGRRWSEVTLHAVAERAGVSLAELRGAYDGRLAILADYIRRTDETVLAGLDPSLAEEAPRERLFDVLFARFEAHAPHRDALRNVVRAARTDPLLALQLNALVANSMAWMLTGAGISVSGGSGVVKAQGLALVWARVMRVFLDDDDPALARTMAALDKHLKEAERAKMRLDRLKAIIDMPRRARSRRSRASQSTDEPDVSIEQPT